MTTPDLARRLVEHPMWTQHVLRGLQWASDPVASSGVIPDLDHPATKGWLLHMLREATGEWDVSVWREDGLWGAGVRVGTLSAIIGVGPTEGAALASALLAAWGGHG